MKTPATDLLGKNCPFGQESSSKHMSEELDCPDLRASSGADRQISHALRDFLASVGGRSRWQRMPLDAFEMLARDAHAVHANAPRGLADVFPLDESRNAEALLDRIAEANSLMSRAVLGAHRHAYLRLQSHRLATRSVMAAIGHAWDEITMEKGVGELQLVSLLDRLAGQRRPRAGWRAPSAFGSDRGIAISNQSIQTLLAYQTIQERIDSAAEIARINLALAERMTVIEDLLGILAAITDDLRAWIAEEPERRALARAFSEIAVIDEAGEIIPNSRFLKILVHNWGEFIAQRPLERIDRTVAHCAAQARLNLIYEQSILVLRRADSARMLYGIAVRACPAAAIVGPLVSHYAALPKR